MYDPILRQFQHECNFFRRLTEFIGDETINMRIRATEVLKENFGRKMLESIEYFQDEFLKIDQIVKFVRNDVSELNDSLMNKELTSEKIKQIRLFRDGLCKKAYSMKKRFYELLVKFNNVLLDNILE